MIATGTFINIGTVALGTSVGLLAGRRIPTRFRETLMDGVGLVTIAIAISMAIRTQQILVPLGAVLLGALAGEALDLDARMERLGRWAEMKLGGHTGAVEGWSVSRGFVTTSLVFCVGPLTVLGSIQDGLVGDFRLLAIKSSLDLFASMVFAAALGPGVYLTLGTILVVQGGITVAALLLGSALGNVTETTPWVVEMSATGGVLLIGIGLGLLELKTIRMANLLPAILFAPILAVCAQKVSALIAAAGIFS